MLAFRPAKTCPSHLMVEDDADSEGAVGKLRENTVVMIRHESPHGWTTLRPWSVRRPALVGAYRRGVHVNRNETEENSAANFCLPLRTMTAWAPAQILLRPKA
jgi:hypothetical protein